MEINGIAHTMITVANFDACVAFYRRLLPFMGLSHVVYDEKDYFYCIGGRTGFGVIRCAEKYRGERADQTRQGVHHICFRARSSEDVDAVHDLVRELGAKIIRGPEVGHWAPGYYSVLFEDPDGVLLEVNYIPGKGLLAENTKPGRWSESE
ncbi:MAG: VOC family protein, partial [Candidatus Binataceae bacterium]